MKRACERCGEPQTRDATRYCSKACYAAARTKPRPCEHCGKRRSWSGRRYCSQECYHAASTRDMTERFWAHVNKTDDCWLWVGSRSKFGYGSFTIRAGQSAHSHRLAWTLTHGAIPDGLQVCHVCDNPPCVRPDHMFLGTARDNAHDAVRKGRYPRGNSHASRVHPGYLSRGERHHMSKLTDDAVRQIRSAYANGVSRKILSRQFQVCWTTIDNVVAYRIWRHVV